MQRYDITIFSFFVILLAKILQRLFLLIFPFDKENILFTRTHKKPHCGKNKNMIDTKSKLVLSILAKECKDGSYKIVEVPDIIMALPKHFRMDTEAVKHILTHLERQDIVSIKYDDDDVFCLAVMPYGFEILENEKPRLLNHHKPKEKSLNWTIVFLSFFSALLGTTLGIVISYFLLKLF